MDNQQKTVAQKRNFKTLVPAVATGAMVLSGSAFAEGGDLSTDAVAQISGGSTTLTAVGLAIIGVVAGIWVIRKVIGMIR